MRKYLFFAVMFCSQQYAFAQLAVRNEPRHHNVFENDYVRVLDAYLAPHDTTQFHVHATPSVFIALTRTATGSQIAGKQPVKSIYTAGDATYDSLVTPRIHRVWNEDTTWFHIMDIELIGGTSHTNEPVLQGSFIQLLFDEPQVRGYRVQPGAKENFKLPASKTGYLVVSIGEASVTFQSRSVQHRLMKAGHYSWIQEETVISSNDASAVFIVLQLK